jgi:hypothetical protein
MPAVNHSGNAADPAADEPTALGADPAGEENAGEDAEESKPANPLEALRRAQANRSMPPGAGGPGGGRVSKGAHPKAPRMYNRHK